MSKRAGRERREVADGGCFACHPITIDDDYDGDELGNREKKKGSTQTYRRAGGKKDKDIAISCITTNNEREWSTE